MGAFVPHTFNVGDPLTVSLFNDHISGPLNLLAPGDGTAQTVGTTSGSLALIPLSNNSAAMLTGHVMGVRSDFGAALHARFGATFRMVGGVISVAGSYCDVYEDSAGAPTVVITWAAPNLCRIAVVGVAAETWNWKAVYSFVEL